MKRPIYTHEINQEFITHLYGVYYKLTGLTVTKSISIEELTPILNNASLSASLKTKTSIFVLPSGEITYNYDKVSGKQFDVLFSGDILRKFVRPNNSGFSLVTREEAKKYVYRTVTDTINEKFGKIGPDDYTVHAVSVTGNTREGMLSTDMEILQAAKFMKPQKYQEMLTIISKANKKVNIGELAEKVGMVNKHFSTVTTKIKQPMYIAHNLDLVELSKEAIKEVKGNKVSEGLAEFLEDFDTEEIIELGMALRTPLSDACITNAYVEVDLTTTPAKIIGYPTEDDFLKKNMALATKYFLTKP